MSTITLSCLVVDENPYENVFEVDIVNNKTVNRLKDATKSLFSITLLPKNSSYGRWTFPSKKKTKN